MRTTIVYWGYFGIMENRTEAANIGIMEKSMETTIVYSKFRCNAPSHACSPKLSMESQFGPLV